MQALTMALSASAGAGYIVSRSYLGTDIALLDVWVGIAIMQASRAVTFSIRHWLDPRGPLAKEKDLGEMGEDNNINNNDDNSNSNNSPLS